MQKNNFDIIEIGDTKWNQCLQRSFIYDFHHTDFYHRLDTPNKSLLLVASEGDDFIALPVVIRPIDGTIWSDLTSVYGYCGPISNIQDPGLSENLIRIFHDGFISFCKSQNIVSAFSRLHPLIHQVSVFNNFGNVVELNKTVAIDLRLSAEQQKAQYRKSNKSELNQLRRKGFTVEEAKSEGDVDKFIEIYYETMDRVNATPNYYFTKEYFHLFLNSEEFSSKLLLAKFEDQIVAGAIFTVTDKIMQYHLAGTHKDYIRLTPMKLLIDEARLLGNSLTLEFLHLGGGVGGSDEDSLFRFKSGFSDHRCQYRVWNYILDEDAYNQLSNGKPESNFFPLYRS
jgi:lipid II:glycine glycyltransferase (peptidoglycan interpeptide bridge formation enzyme)